nr:protein-serine O-palmitoleoyltransferase porcupine isoform X1 [Parasteatoda tepidariorum]
MKWTMDDYYYDPELAGEDLYDDIYEDYSDLLYDSVDYTLKELWKDCLLPTLYDGFNSCAKLLFFCSILKLTLSLDFLPHHTFHLQSSFLGVCCLYSFFGRNCLYIFIFAAVGYVVLLLTHRILKQYQGIICAIVCFLFLATCELFFADKKLWHRIRGCQMLLSMKLISLAFDTNYIDKTLPPVISSCGYLLHPGTVIFGPWISYSSYSNSKIDSKFDFLWLLTVCRSLLFSFGFLTISTCWSSWILYSTSFKASTVAAAFNIEVPRSLVEVVVWWNVPMHFWLKTYVFKTTKSLGSFAAVLFTYAASSLLHGLNFQLAAVLLSLGFYTYIEHVLRKKLSDIFSACIQARNCKPDCDHVFKQDHLYVRVTNVAFGLLAVFHLAYLGVMFDSTSNIQEEGYNMAHTLQKWSDLNYASHWVAFFTYLFYYLI